MSYKIFSIHLAGNGMGYQKVMLQTKSYKIFVAYLRDLCKRVGVRGQRSYNIVITENGK